MKIVSTYLSLIALLYHIEKARAEAMPASIFRNIDERNIFFISYETSIISSHVCEQI